MIHADAVVLSVLPGDMLQLHVFPQEGRNFVTEVISRTPEDSGFCIGKRVRVKYIRDKQSSVEIIELPGL